MKKLNILKVIINGLFFSNDHSSLPSNNIQLNAFQVLRLCIFYIYNCSPRFLAALTV